MTGWNLPPGCTARDIDEAAGAYDEQPPPLEADLMAEALCEADVTVEKALRFIGQDMPITAAATLRAYIVWRAEQGRR